MATPPLDSYIKTPPPSEPDSQFPYLEDQFQRIEGTMSNHTKRIVTVDSNLTLEELTRSNADNSIAQYVTAASVGASNVFTQSTPPTVTGRLQGDVWYDTANSFTPYVWYASAWQNNSTGSYTQYVGQIATINTSLSSTKNKVDNTLGVQWSVKANINNSTGGLTFTGIQKADGTGATYNLEINSNVTINGSLLVSGSVGNTQIADGAITTGKISAGSITADKISSGSITADKISSGSITADKISSGSITSDKISSGSITADKISGGTITADKIVAGTITGTYIANGAVDTPKIFTNAVSNSASAQGNGSASASITVRAGARVSVLATYAGNRSNGTGGGSNTLRVRANGSDFTNNSTTIFSVALVTSASSLAYINGSFVVTGLVTNYASTPATLLTIYNAGSDGTIDFTADSGGWNEVVSLLVMELAK